MPSIRDRNPSNGPSEASPTTRLRDLIHRFLTSATQKRYLENTAWLLAERVLRLTVGLSVGVYVVRSLGPKSYGELAFAFSFVGLFVAIATLGLPGIVIRELVKNPSRRGELLGSTFGLYMVGSLLTVGLVAAVTPFVGATRAEQWMILIIAAAIVTDSFRVIDLYFQSIAQSRFVVQVEVVQLVLSSLIKIALIWKGAELIWFAVVAVVDSVVIAAGLVLNYHRTQSRTSDSHPWHFRWGTARDLMRDAWPLVLSGIVVAIYMRIDQVMIRAMLDADAVGKYAAAVRISEAWYFVPVLIAQSYFPAIIAAKAEGQEALDRRLQVVYNVLIWLGLGVAIVSMLMAKRIILFLYGPQFVDSSPVLAIHIWAGVFVAAAVLRGKWFIAMDLQKYSFLTVVIGATLNVIGNLTLIPILGMNGAAWSTLAARFLSFYLIALFFPEIRVTITSFHRALFSPLRLLFNRGP